MMHEYIQQQLGITVQKEQGPGLFSSVGLGLRKNPKRAHLFVSHLLGKHIPVAPHILLEAVEELCAGREQLPSPGYVLGYAETATSLGFLVARALNLPYLASTRYPQGPIFGSFEESHSHAPSHVLTPEHPEDMLEARTIVLVDDELTTGNTVLATIASLEERSHHEQYVVATLLDSRTQHWREHFQQEAQRLGVRIDVWARTRAEVSFPEDVLDRGSALASSLQDLTQEPSLLGVEHHPVQHVLVEHEDRIARGLRLEDYGRMEETAGTLAALCPQQGRVLVLGAEELMSLPLLLARHLEHTNADVRSSSTTLSPVLVSPREDYPIRHGISVYLDRTWRFSYNVRGFDHIVLVAPEYLRYLPVAQRLSWESPVTFLELHSPSERTTS